jgi:hypothetical protein
MSQRKAAGWFAEGVKRRSLFIVCRLGVLTKIPCGNNRFRGDGVVDHVVVTLHECEHASHDGVVAAPFGGTKIARITLPGLKNRKARQINRSCPVAIRRMRQGGGDKSLLCGYFRRSVSRC